MPISRTRREGLRRAAVQAYSKAIVEGRDQLAIARKKSAAPRVPEGDVDGPADRDGPHRGDHRPGGSDHRVGQSVP